MTDPKKETEDHIVATEGDGPEDVGDVDLDDASGGYLKITMTNVATNLETAFGGTPLDTIYAGAADDVIHGGSFNTAGGGFTPDTISTLRKWPGR